MVILQKPQQPTTKQMMAWVQLQAADAPLDSQQVAGMNGSTMRGLLDAISQQPQPAVLAGLSDSTQPITTQAITTQANSTQANSTQANSTQANSPQAQPGPSGDLLVQDHAPHGHHLRACYNHAFFVFRSNRVLCCHPPPILFLLPRACSMRT